MKSSLSIQTLQLSHSIGWSAWWPADQLICTAVYVVPYLTQRSTYFLPRSHEGSRQIIAYLQQTPTGTVDLLRKWTSLLMLGTFIKWSLWLLMSQWIGIWKTVWAPLRRVWLKMGRSTCILSQKPVSIWFIPLSSLDPRLAGPETSLHLEGNLKTLYISCHPRSHGR